MKKILITGANGFLGANLTRELFRQGYEVRIFVRPRANLSALSGISCEIFFGHINNKEEVQQAVAGCQIVIHAAAITDQWGIPFSEYENINFTGTKYVAEAVMQSQADKLIYVSTANTMAPGSKKNPGTELNGFTLLKANSGYITTKYLAQQYLLEQVEQKKLPAVIVNPTFMIGANDSKPSSGKLLLYGLNKKILFYPPGGKNFVYINDVCKGIAKAIQTGKTGECYLLAGHNLSYKEFFTLVNRVTGASAIMIPIPGFLLKLGGFIGSIKEKIGCRPGKLNYTTAYLICLHSYYSGKKSERELNVKYTALEHAIREALTWFKEHNYY